MNTPVDFKRERFPISFIQYSSLHVLNTVELCICLFFKFFSANDDVSDWCEKNDLPDQSRAGLHEMLQWSLMPQSNCLSSQRRPNAWLFCTHSVSLFPRRLEIIWVQLMPQFKIVVYFCLTLSRDNCGVFALIELLASNWHRPNLSTSHPATSLLSMKTMSHFLFHTDY